MVTTIHNTEHTPEFSAEVREPVKTVYGPVPSWRYGLSLGIDLIRDTSTCSFNCIYCQLGNIQQQTVQRQLFVSTDEVMNDLKTVDYQSVDVITFSGSGEPTLATNLSECLDAVKQLTHKPLTVLTNGTLLHDPAVQQALLKADTVSLKLDAASDKMLKMVNRPVDGVTLTKIIEGAKAFRQIYPGKLSLQMMFMPINLAETDELAALINQIQPDEVQLNTPTRPYPLQWVVDSRGNHTQTPEYPAVKLRTISPEQAEQLETRLKALTNVPIVSVYRKTN